MRVLKGDWNGTVSRNNIKKMASIGAKTGVLRHMQRYFSH